MNKLERLLYILNRLDRGERVNARSLAEELGVTERTIFRYIQTLKEAGFPIYFDTERKSYVFEEGYSLRKGNLNLEEFLTLEVAKRLLSKTLGEEAEKVYVHLIKKCQFSHLEREDNLSLVIQEVVNIKNIFPLLRELMIAIKEQEIVEIEYEKKLGSKPIRREIEPITLFYALGFWYIYARERENFTARTFALDKVLSLRRTGKYFSSKEDLEIDPKRIEEAFGPFPDQEKRRIVIMVAPEIREYFLRKRWVKEQEVRELEGGFLEVTFYVRGLEVFKHWLYSWLPYIKILHPKELAEELTRDLKKALLFCENMDLELDKNKT